MTLDLREVSIDSQRPEALAPTVSVIIPTRDRPARLGECLAALARSNTGRDRFEVIVVDDGGRETLETVIGAFTDDIDLRLLCQPASGPARARNAGAAVARAGLLAFTDDDCRPAPDWLEQLARRHAEAPEAAVGGSVRNSVERNDFSQASQLLLDYLYRRSNPDGAEAAFFASCNLAVPRGRFLESGGFNESYPFAAAEDRDFCRRWKERGGRLVYAERAIVHHFHTLGPLTFFRQHFRYGRGSRRFRNETAESTGSRPRFERSGFYLGIVLEPFTRMPLLPALRVSTLLAISQLATVLGFTWEVIRAAPSVRAAPALSRSSERGLSESPAVAREYLRGNRR